MLESLGGIILGFFIGIVLFIIFEPMTGGGFMVKGTKKYDKCSRDIDRKIKNKLKNGTGSSKQELQQWWDKYH